MSTDYSNLKSQYPSVISADQFRQICHISKRKAKWLLENDIVPCEDSGKRRGGFRYALTMPSITLRPEMMRPHWWQLLPVPSPADISTPEPCQDALLSHRRFLNNIC